LLRGLHLQAESTGVAIAVEAAHGRWLLSPVELRELIDAANSWAIGACIDLARVSAVGSPIDWITTLTHRVKAVRWNVGPKSRNSIDSHGAIVDPMALKNALDAVGFRGPIIIPPEHACADWLRIVSGE
jgi:sugar phosphate isomerase/epimerase